MEGGEVATQDGPDTARVVGAKFDDAAVDDGVLWQEEFVVGVDGVEQVGANWLSVAQGKMLVDAQGERGFGGKSAAFSLA